MKTKMIFIGLMVATLSLKAQSYSYTEYVDVTRSKPVYKNVTIKVPYQECWEKEVPVRKKHQKHNDFNDAIGPLIGGVAGGIIGNQVGKGRGKTVATVGGAIIGSLVGNNLSNRENRYYENEPTRYKIQKQCVTKYKENREKRFKGYKNVGFYKNQKITKFSKHRLNSIPITITVNY